MTESLVDDLLGEAADELEKVFADLAEKFLDKI
jgi:hypothetical protein